MEFKIHGATPKTGKPICTTCKYATTHSRAKHGRACIVQRRNVQQFRRYRHLQDCSMWFVPPHERSLEARNGTDCVDRASSPPGSIGFSNSGWRGPDGSHDKRSEE